MIICPLSVRSQRTCGSARFALTVHGMGTYVAAVNQSLLLEEQKKELEADLELAVQKGRRYGISDEDIRSLFELVLEDSVQSIPL